MNNTGRFSSRADNYVKYRPHYPSEIIPFLKDRIGYSPNWVLADIGSGTGISSELFLKNGNIVYGVEPNLEMREKAEILLKNEKNFISINGTAEATNLSDKSIDLIIAGQAFHWFDKIKSKIEFHRIANPNAYLLLMWNDRKIKSGFLKAYEDLLMKYSLDYKEVVSRYVDENAIRAFFSPNICTLQTFKNSQYFDYESLKGRLLSSSYAPLEGHPNFEPMIRRLEQIFEEFKEDSKVDFVYSCNLYFGKISKNKISTNN